MKPKCRRNTWAALLAAGAYLWAGGPACAENNKITVSGLIDWYYQYSFNHPATGALLSPPRAFDVKHDAFSLSLVEVNIHRAVSPESPLGFTATLTLGKTADIVHFTEPGGTQNAAKLSNDTIYKYTQQLFGTYLAGKTTIDFGKFVTHMGYEVIESSSNDHYSRGLLFTYAIPLYHMGLRITHPLTPTLTGQVHLVNGWNNVEDDNGGKSYGLQLNFKPNSTLNAILNYLGGDESAGALLPANLNVQLVDLAIILSPTANWKLGANVDYASAGKRGAAGGNWSGWALYARHQLADNSAVAVRWERFQDTNGLRTGASQNLSSITATYEYVAKGNLLSRLEYRRDTAGRSIFASGSGTSRSMDTLTFGQVLKF